MRIGWGFSSKLIIEALQRVRGPFNLSVPALAVAEAAINDQDYVETVSYTHLTLPTNREV